jgi:hypothetical protein
MMRASHGNKDVLPVRRMLTEDRGILDLGA